MRMVGRSVGPILALSLALTACATPLPSAGPAQAAAAYLPPLGSNQVFRAPTAAAPGHELIVADLRPGRMPWARRIGTCGRSSST